MTQQGKRTGKSKTVEERERERETEISLYQEHIPVAPMHHCAVE